MRPGLAVAAAALAITVASAAPRSSGHDDLTITHLLNRIAYGPRPGDIERVRAMGLARYIEQQLHPDQIDDAGLEGRIRAVTSRHASAAALARDDVQNRRGAIAQLSEQKLMRATYSERQLQAVLTDFWFNHFNVFAGKGADRIFVTSYERDAIRPHVLGTFRALLGATAHSPAMLFYLDNWMSTKSGLNENYGRELMELHTLGVDGGYTQEDVIAVARAFTGWTIDRPRMGGGFRFDPRMHDRDDKHVLGQTIRAGGERDGEQVLDILARHPSTASFISMKLARRFVSDDPPQALVERAAKTFLQSDGDIREVVRTILQSPEFLSPDARGAKIKTPFEFVASALRASSAEVTRGAGLARALQQLGMPLYLAQPPTGYADTADAWINTGGLVNRMNFAVSLVDGQVPGARIRQGTASPSALVLGSPEFQRR